MVYKLAKHASEYRIERLYYIHTQIGIGNEVCRSREKPNGLYEVLTDTGILLVVNKESVLITAYIATMKKATAVWRNIYGEQKMPNCVYTAILHNKKQYENVKKLDDLFGYHENRKEYKFFD